MANINTPEAMREAAAQCPRCGSKDPHRHPAMQFEGEVEICTDDFHLRRTNQNTQQYIDAVLAKRALPIAPPTQTGHDARAMEWLLNEALTKVENDRSMWNAEWLEWCVSVRAALTAKVPE